MLAWCVRVKWWWYKQADYNHSLGTVHETCCSAGSAGDTWSKVKCEIIWFHTLMLPVLYICCCNFNWYISQLHQLIFFYFALTQTYSNVLTTKLTSISRLWHSVMTFFDNNFTKRPWSMSMFSTSQSCLPLNASLNVEGRSCQKQNNSHTTWTVEPL